VHGLSTGPESSASIAEGIRSACRGIQETDWPATVDVEAARTGRSISALIRDAVEIVYGTQRSSEDDLAAMRRAFGSWADRDTDGADWVEERRSGGRLHHRGS
jgi:hypothetical protein